MNVTCRRCKTKFRVTAAGAEPLPPEEAAPAADAGSDVVAQAIAAESTDTKSDAAPMFEGASTDVMKVPEAAAAPSGGLADALEPEPADADVIETIDESEPLEEAPAVVPAPMDLAPTATGYVPLGDDEVTANADHSPAGGPSLGELSAASDVGTAEPAPAPYDGGPSGLPIIAPQAQPAEIFPEQPTVIEGAPAAAALEAEKSSPEPRSEAGAGTFEPALQPDKPRKVKSNKPSAAAIYGRHLMHSFSLASPGKKAAMLGLPLVLLVIAIVLVAMSGGPPPLHKQWITSPASMWSGPAAQRGYAQIDTLVRGEEVVFLREVFGDYALVRDIWGRVGYVNRESLSDERPSVTPESQFPGCRQAPIDADKEPCEIRARALHDACGGTCAADGQCLSRCQDRFSECNDGCKTRLSVPQVVAEAKPAAEEPAEAPAEEPEEQPIDKMAAEKPIKATKTAKAPRTTVTKKTTKKTDGKKKR